MGHRMTKLEVLKIKILSSIIKKLEPSESEYINYEKEIRQSKLDENLGYNTALGFIVLTRALRITIDHFIVFMIRALSIVFVVLAIIKLSYG